MSKGNTIAVTAVTDSALRSMGYTHEFSVTNWAGYCVRVGLVKGMNFTKFRQILRGEKISK